MTWRQKRRLKRKGEDEKEGEREVDGQVSFLVRTRREGAFGSNRMAERDDDGASKPICKLSLARRRPGIKTARQMRSDARTRGQSVSAVRLRARSIWSPIGLPPMQAALPHVIPWTNDHRATAAQCEDAHELVDFGCRGALPAPSTEQTIINSFGGVLHACQENIKRWRFVGLFRS